MGDPIPPPLQAHTEEDVQEMFGTGYSNYFTMLDPPFWDGDAIGDVVQGTHVLWKNVPTGKNGGQSTKVEYFHGTCHGWYGQDYVIVS